MYTTLVSAQGGDWDANMLNVPLFHVHVHEMSNFYGFLWAGGGRLLECKNLPPAPSTTFARLPAKYLLGAYKNGYC